MNQLKLIVELLGTPNDSIWPGLSSLPSMKNVQFEEQPYNKIKLVFNWMSDAGIRLLNFLFMYDPRQRATATECLQSAFFKENPLPCGPAAMPTFPNHRTAVPDYQ